MNNELKNIEGSGRDLL